MNAESVAHRLVRGPELDVLGHGALVADGDRYAEQRSHPRDDVVDADGCAGCEVDGRARALRLHEREKAVDGIVYIHEVDQVLPIAAHDEFALTRGHALQP